MPFPYGRGSNYEDELALLLALRAFLRILLLGNVAGAALFEGGRAFGVKRCKAGPLRRNVGLGEDSLDRTFGNTSFTIDAVNGIDVKHLLVLVEAFHRADGHAIRILAVVARLANSVSHCNRSFLLVSIYGRPSGLLSRWIEYLIVSIPSEKASVQKITRVSLLILTGRRAYGPGLFSLSQQGGGRGKTLLGG